MNETFDVARIAETGRVALPLIETDGVATPQRGRRMTRASREVAGSDDGPRPPAFWAREPQALGEGNADDVLRRVVGALPDHPEASVSPALGDVPYLARDLEDQGRARVSDGQAGGRPQRTTHHPNEEAVREDE